MGCWPTLEHQEQEAVRSMELRISDKSLRDIETPLLAVVAQGKAGTARLLKALGPRIGRPLADHFAEEGFEGKASQTAQLSTLGALGARRIMVIGLGPEDASEAPCWIRSTAARAGRVARSRGLKSFALLVPRPKGVSLRDAVRFAAEGALAGVYRFGLKTGDEKPKAGPRECVLLVSEPPDADLRQALEEAHHHARGLRLARDLVNLPPNLLTPDALAERARSLARRHHLKATVLGPAEIRRRGMELLSAVSRGSGEPPRFVHLRYVPRGKPRGALALVGKGITFDSGGLALKPADSQVEMKGDMAGAAVVLGVLDAAARRELPWRLDGILPLAENMIGGRAFRPGDVLRSAAGKTVEIQNPDAEGRLILADALTYARRLPVDAIIDVATLTGACKVALGPHTAGLFSNSEEWALRLQRAAQRAGESFWRLPLEKPLAELLKSDVADLKNVGGRWGGAITAALFLREFVDDRPWVHIDIAGPAYLDRPFSFHPKGGTGFGVLTLLECLTA